jgi:hypothetical protein
MSQQGQEGRPDGDHLLREGQERQSLGRDEMTVTDLENGLSDIQRPRQVT